MVVDLDTPRARDQQDLVKKYYKGYIPHVVVLSATGQALYDSSGEVEEGTISRILDQALAEGR